MKKGDISTITFLIGIVLGVLILIALFYPLKAMTSLFFGRSQPCIDDASKSFVDNLISEIDSLNGESSAVINFGKGKCIFAIFGKDLQIPGVAPPDGSFLGRNVICMCEFDKSINTCTKNRYCKELDIKSISLIGYNVTYIESKNDYDTSNIIYYRKDGTNLVISNSPFTGFGGGSFSGAGAGRTF